ncbi:hypothetical protein A1O1_07451 [Capronia coronata CBS 617.96]|uniref:WDR59/RTC1-like RING zinc finger domain-containing protein n=1 Tax=Capronia coronata CBS 617.96 TaxID=1182541 RepID=W9YNJ4_9EURO|nr:uncharacterized protein A1O1_07451 [Capronia coronata CBS 617.96]EXJ83824.1 hypothetical protein A1O1_07451 [Capronia coronata CBS 617.96]
MAPRGPASAFESETFGQDASFRLEQPVGSMSISPSGRDVALASKEGLHIIDLDSPYSPPRYLPHRTPWEVADVQWSPFAVRDYWVVSTSNQKALVWNLAARSWQDWIEFVLHGHTRAITDINFSAHNPDVLATCAVDSFVHCWDLRAPLRPVNSFSDWFAGATQVKWSRQDEHVIASSHDKFLHIWDDRHGAYPVRTIEAHGTKISGLDWNRHHPNKIVTCSLDRSIKFWDLDYQENVPERVIETPFPVRRARHTPFGWGLLVMPQRGNHDLHLYDRRPANGMLQSGPVQPVATFAGHEGQVKEFLWRSRGAIVDAVDNRDFQLVSWGTDRELRLHALDRSIYADVGYEKGASIVPKLNFTRRGAVYRSFRDEPEDSDSPVEQIHRGEIFPRPSQVMQLRYRASNSAAMNKVPVSQFRSWVQGRQTRRPGMHGRGNNRQSADPIAWLKNVKISSWDPDTLAEEIRQVGEKFKKVDFEVVDISRRKAVMSLQAPWGEDQSPVYLRVEMRFPKLYPRNANAILTLQKSGFIDDETHKLLTTELNTISETYASRKRGCLEAVLRYLLREQNLEQIVAWVLGESLTDSKVLDTGAIPADDSSSSDDEQMDGVGDGLDASANILVPLAKGCGAIWSPTGKLVCFFPAKSKETVSLLSTIGVGDLDNTESSALFQGFGRLHTSSPARKATRTRTTEDDSDSETSDSSWQSSSSSSSSFETEQNVRGVASYPVGALGLQQRSRSPDRSNNSTTGINKLNDNPRKSAVSIHNVDDLLPSKRELAVQYRIFGDGAQLCKHNAAVARQLSLEDLASVWTLLGLILDDTVPLEVMPDLSHSAPNDISVLARAATKKRPQGDRAADLAANSALGRTRWGNHPLGSTYLLPAIFDHFERLGDIQMLATMSCVLVSVLNRGTIPGDPAVDPWNDSPAIGSVARSDYFPSRAVAKAFLQSELAPEGYVLVDSMNAPPSPGVSTGGFSQNQRRSFKSLSLHYSQLSSRAHSFRADDGSDQGPAQSALSLSTSPEGHRSSHGPTSGIAYSSARASLSALTQSYSNSPPNQSSGSGVASGLKKYSPSGSLAPGWVSSSLFGGQGGNRQARMSLQGSDTASQDHLETNTRTSIPSSALRASRKDSVKQESGIGRRSLKSTASSDKSAPARPNTASGRRKKKIKTHLFNQDKFDLDGYPLSPLLDPILERRCSGYRASYASLLDVWDLPIQRAEMLKFDGLLSEQASATNQLNGTSPMQQSASASAGPHLERPVRRKTLTSATRGPSPGLTIRRCCRNCGDPLVPKEKNRVRIGWRCVNPACSAPSKISERSSCAVCNTSINGLAVPCLQCGHMTCYDCAQGWFGTHRIQRASTAESRRSSQQEQSRVSEDEDEHNTCPTGCGCPCVTLTAVNAPTTPGLLLTQAGAGAEDEAEEEESQNPSLSHIETPKKKPRFPGPPSRGTSDLTRSSSFLLSVPEDSTPGPGPGSDAALAAFIALTQRHQRSKSTTAASNAILANLRNTISGSSGKQPTTTTTTTKSSSISSQHRSRGGGGGGGGGGGAAVAAAQMKRQSSHTGQDEGRYAEEEAVRDDDDEEDDGDGDGDGDDNDGPSQPPPAEEVGDDDDARLNPWVGSKIATLGRGIGAGLSRGLTSKGSDATIRKIK